jgi:DNA repair exonuclease SbcCD ATPase subunit
MVHDPMTGAESAEPYVVLSNSQTSALAISLFIGMNLGASQLPLQACLLDDPLQNLDEVHLLGLVDVLRRLKQTRQVLITTHDTKFASLLARKMRPVHSGRTVVIRLGDQVRAGIGPVLEEIEPDRTPLKFAG